MEKIIYFTVIQPLLYTKCSRYNLKILNPYFHTTAASSCSSMMKQMEYFSTFSEITQCFLKSIRVFTKRNRTSLNLLHGVNILILNYLRQGITSFSVSRYLKILLRPWLQPESSYSLTRVLNRIQWVHEFGWGKTASKFSITSKKI